MKEYNTCLSEMKGEIAAIKAVKLERLKHSPMPEAEKEAEAIMEQAGEEIVGKIKLVAEDVKGAVVDESV